MRLGCTLLSFFFRCIYCTRTTLRVGNLIYLDDTISKIYLNLTVDQIVQERLLPEDFNIELYHATGCDQQTAPEASFKLYTENNIDVLLGPLCSDGMQPIGLFAAGWDLPIMGVMSTGHMLSDKVAYPTLSRISITMDLFAQATIALLKQMGWRTFGLVSVASCDFDALYPSALKVFADNNGVSISVQETIVMNQSHADLQQAMIKALTAIQNGARIVVVSLGMEISDARDFLLLCKQMNMISPEYVFIIPWTNHNPNAPLPWDFGDGLDESVGELFEKVLTFVPAGYADDDVRKTIVPALQVAHMNMSDIHRAMYLPNMHDALYLYALCVNSCLADTNCNWRSGRDIFDKAKNRIFDGHSGRVVMSDTADRLADFVVISAEHSNDSYQFATRFILEVSPGQNGNQTWSLAAQNSFAWLTPDGIQPPDTPQCGFTGANCGKLMNGDTLGLVSLTLLCATIILSLALVRLKQWRFERDLLALSWNVPVAELNLPDDAAPKEDISYLMHDLEAFTVPVGTQAFTVRSLSDNDLQSPQSSRAVSEVKSHCFSAIYRDQRVQVHTYRFHERLDEITKRHDLLKLKTIKDLNHENVLPFVGIVTDHPKKFMIVWGAADKGPLEHIIHNKERTLDFPFKASILKDLVRALEYLHSSKVHYHGRLTIRNCLLDARWVLKVSDYSLRDIIEPFNRIPGNIDLLPEQDTKLLLQLAPEVLRIESKMLAKGSPDADIFSFGMILYQILFRIQPYEFSGIASDQDMLEQVRNPGNLLIRPLIPASHGFHVDLVNLIPSCWSEKPLSRPRLPRVRNVVFGVLSHYANNVVDHIMAVMDTQTTDLERIVATRTQELQEERIKTEELLYQLLPPYIAESLKNGCTHEAELFDMVTVGIFGVVDFAGISARLTPNQLVQIIDKLFVLIDETVALFDAMKMSVRFHVETAGDRCIIVSGLPCRNDSNHAREIANLSLELLQNLRSHSIETMPGERWQMRVGVHTGSIVAGVVGKTFPRYCLFGDTINIAKSLQRSGEPMRIQISHATKVTLDRLAHDDYWIERRGMVAVKNKGQREAFWLERKLPTRLLPT